MISVTEAQKRLLEHLPEYSSEFVALNEVTNRVLDEDVIADRDFPAFDRVTMDGIAIRFDELIQGKQEFPIAGIQAAGAPPMDLVDPKSCIEVMTGAVLPNGCDTVVPYEDLELKEGFAMLQRKPERSGINIHKKGLDQVAGRLLLNAGQQITPGVIGLLASVGKGLVKVKKLPTVAVISTGDELIDIDLQPLPHQIRRSNSFMLSAALITDGIKGDSFHLPDDQHAMELAIRKLLNNYEVLIFTGAVSKGKFDFLPEVLEACGVQTLFHRVAQRPGKPILFGKHPAGSLIFGFPGNPVSSLVCYHVYFRYWLHQVLGLRPQSLSAQLEEEVVFKPNLDLHLLVSLRMKDGVLFASPAAGNNSGDLVSLARANGMLHFPATQSIFPAGSSWPLSLLHPM